MEATSAEIYNHSESYTDANTYTARNTACFNLFTHMAANPPTGWSVISSTIPAASSSAMGSYDVVLEGQGFRLKIYVGTSALRFYVEVQTTAGVQNLSSGSYYNALVLSGTYQYQFNITITSYYTADKLYALVFASSYTGVKKTIAKIYTADKADGAEDWLIASDFYSSTQQLATASKTSSPYITAPSTNMVNASGQYLAIPEYVCTYSSPSYYYYARLINTYAVYNSSALFTPGNIYTDGTDSYLPIGYNYTVLIKL